MTRGQCVRAAVAALDGLRAAARPAAPPHLRRGDLSLLLLLPLLLSRPRSLLLLLLRRSRTGLRLRL
jgi:hypothetical protein